MYQRCKHKFSHVLLPSSDRAPCGRRTGPRPAHGSTSRRTRSSGCATSSATPGRSAFCEGDVPVTRERHDSKAGLAGPFFFCETWQHEQFWKDIKECIFHVRSRQTQLFRISQERADFEHFRKHVCGCHQTSACFFGFGDNNGE